jgi:hypothetical protein
MNILHPPVYDGKGSLTKYIREFEKFKAFVIKEKYNVILQFINEWLGTDYKTINNFSNRLEDDLLKNEKENRCLCRKYAEIFNKKFGIDLEVDSNTDSDEIKNKYIVFLLSKMVNSIDYHLSKKIYGNKTLYSIRKK